MTRETIKAALFDAFRADPSKCESARVMRIKNTLALENLWVSESLLAEVNGG